MIREWPNEPDPTQPPPIHGGDEVAEAKLNLLQLTAEADRDPPGAVSRHPYACVATALAAGVLVGRVPMLRRVLFKALAWGASNYAQRAMQQWMHSSQGPGQEAGKR